MRAQPRVRARGGRKRTDAVIIVDIFAAAVGVDAGGGDVDRFDRPIEILVLNDLDAADVAVAQIGDDAGIVKLPEFVRCERKPLLRR